MCFVIFTELLNNSFNDFKNSENSKSYGLKKSTNNGTDSDLGLW